jgi:hypothetical protein
MKRRPGRADPARPDPFGGTHAPGAGGAPAAGRAAAMLGPLEPQTVAVDEFLPLAIPEAGRRGPGRPQGAANIRTNTTFQVAISRYGDPLIATVAWGNMPTRELIRELRTIAADCGLQLGATVMDVVRFQEECRRNAMPFGHAKRASVDGRGDPVLPIIGIGSVETLTVTGGARSIEDELAARQAAAKTIDLQGDSAAAAAVSHEKKSHEDASD